jgi:hypothetical protein
MPKISMNYKIPFGPDYKGVRRLITYEHPSYQTKGVEWKDNYIFKDSMQILEYSRGRSSILFSLKSQTDGTEYSVFVSDMMDIISSCTITNGLIMDKEWTFIKKGSNYGMKLYK